MWSFVQKKKAKAWVWVVFEPVSRQVITFYIGNRGMQSMKILWQKIPHKMRRYCFFETNDWEAYQCVLPKDQHWVGKAYIYFIEGFFAEVRARVSRLVRKSFFSKKWENHVTALKYFFWQFNLEQQWKIR